MGARLSPTTVSIVALAVAAFISGCNSGSSALPPPGIGFASPTPALSPAGSAKIPLMDLGTGTYLGFEGGLYPSGSNSPPPPHAAAGTAHAAAIQPLDSNGNPSSSGKIVLMSIGMSNTTDEWCGSGNGSACNSWTFTGLAQAGGGLNPALVIADGALGGQAAAEWLNAFTPCLNPPIDGYCTNYDRVAALVLPPLGVTEKQVQAIWLKEADPGPTVSLPSSGADAYTLEGYLGQIVRAAKTRYPNLQIIFLSSRIYAGYATTGLNPEPYAYESGFADKWLIAAQINQIATGTVDPIAGDLNYNNGTAPWLAWAAYLWANGTTPRSDGLVWCNGQTTPPCSGEVDFQSDGTHPSVAGDTKVGNLLLTFFKTSPYASPWFL